jgi:3-oxoacyl-(acyl-carrier-protein) synthase
LERQFGESTVSTPVLRVPAEGATTPKFARLRRTSPISKLAAAAAVEALGEERLAAIAAGTLRVGVIFTLTNGCVNYSNRFFAEALADPAMASPILFPETVFNAPSSHLSAMIGSVSPNDTLIGDSSGFFTGIDLAVEWIERGDVDGCLVGGASLQVDEFGGICRFYDMPVL